MLRTLLRLRRQLSPLPLILALIVGGTATAQDTFDDGTNGVYIGHSFFVPIAKAFDNIAQTNGYPEHSAEMVFAGGPKGTPSALWNDRQKKERIEQSLATGKVELFGMTAEGNRGDGPQEAYQRWIDLALRYNPDTVFFIGHSWVPGGPRADAQGFADKTQQAVERAYAEVEKLRDLYPNTTIHFIDYGIVASTMLTMFEAGELNDITTKVAGKGRRSREGGRRSILGRMRSRRSDQDSSDAEQPTSSAGGQPAQSALFADGGIGHAGPMMTQVSALVWMHFLYDADTDDIALDSWDRSDVREIVSAATQANQRYLPN